MTMYEWDEQKNVVALHIILPTFCEFKPRHAAEIRLQTWGLAENAVNVPWAPEPLDK